MNRKHTDMAPHVLLYMDTSVFAGTESHGWLRQADQDNQSHQEDGSPGGEHGIAFDYSLLSIDA